MRKYFAILTAIMTFTLGLVVSSPVSAGGGVLTEAGLAALVNCESSGNYEIVNFPYSGAVQWVASTWRHAARGAGYGEWAGGLAAEAPRGVQDAVTIWWWANSTPSQQWPICHRRALAAMTSTPPPPPSPFRFSIDRAWVVGQASETERLVAVGGWATHSSGQSVPVHVYGAPVMRWEPVWGGATEASQERPDVGSAGFSTIVTVPSNLPLLLLAFIDPLNPNVHQFAVVRIEG